MSRRTADGGHRTGQHEEVELLGIDGFEEDFETLDLDIVDCPISLEN